MAQSSNTAISPEQVQYLLSSIYDAALDENQWEDVLITLAATFNAEQGIMRMVNPKSLNVSHVHTLNKDPAWTQAYIDHYVQQDPWVKILLDSKGTWLECTHHILSDKEYEALGYYSDFVAPQEMHHGIGGRINIKNDAFCYMSFQRRKERQGFEQQYLDALRGLVPHIQKAVLINEKTRHLKFENNLLKDTLNQVNNPLLLVNARGKIVYINSLAEQLLNQQPNISIVNNCIFIHSHEENKKIQHLIHQATSHDTQTSLKQGGAMCYHQPGSNSYLSIMVTPVNPDRINNDTSDDEMAILLLNTNHCKISLSAELLKGLYNLTPAEARLVLHLCEGLTLDEISEKLCITKNTLKSQLRSSFRKTSVSRQSELINLVNTGPASVIKT
jgi:DNA-binding CsgD family transcriptional regulator/PAS domain-containing protein